MTSDNSDVTVCNCCTCTPVTHRC